MNPRHGQERGQDLVEYALVLPLFLFLAFSIIELSLLFFDYITVSNAAREGARAGNCRGIGCL
jgi:Flp pilus assembly protein TadG